MKLTIAITGLNAGENPQPGPGVIRSLRRHFHDIRIVGLAYGTLESGIYAEDSADAVYQIPYPSAGIDALLERLDYIREKDSIDILIPTLDAEIQPLISVQDQLTARGIKTILPTLGSFQARSKDKLHELLEDTETTVPMSTSVYSSDELVKAAVGMRYPMMVKGLYYDAHKVYAQSELEVAFHKIMGEWGGPVIVQEFIDGEEFNIAVIGDGEGRVVASCAIRKSVRSDKGKGFGGIVIDDPELNALGQRIIEKLKWNGPCELEFIQDSATGRYYLLEINPRFPAWIDFPSTFDYNLPRILVERITGAESSAIPEQCPTGYFFLRHSVDICARIEDMAQLTTKGELDRNSQPFQQSIR